MRQTRRGFVGGAAAFGAGTMLPWSAAIAQVRPVRQSLASFSRDPSKVASLRRGVGVMKARAPSDPKSWFFQSAIHAYSDEAYADALAHDPGVARVNAQRYWNKCPHFGQSSANFLLWHRAYLYVFERILREAANDPTLALPYWDYSISDGREFPVIFANQTLAGGAPNPLYHANREMAFANGLLEISDDVGEARTTMAVPNFFSDVGRVGFAGDTLDSEHTQLGLIEQRPHSEIHELVGGVIGTANGAMADIPTAAFDPVFWVHHANIDRLWAEWSCMPGKSWGPMPSSAWFDEAPWEFLDVDGTTLQRSRRFFIERGNIAVFYDTDKSHGPPMPLPPPVLLAEAPPPPPPPPGGGLSNNRAAPAPVELDRALRPSDRELIADATPVIASARKAAVRALAETSTETVVATGSRPPENVQAAPVTASPPAGSPAPVGSGGRHAPPETAAKASPPPPPPPPPLEAAAPARRRVTLELSEITFARTPSSGFAVYLLDAGDVAVGSKGSFVGLLDLFGATHVRVAGMAGMNAAQRFDVTDIVAKKGLDLTIRIEPYDLLVSKSGRPAPKRDDAVTIGKVRFVETA